jgi:hypothetical protein
MWRKQYKLFIHYSKAPASPIKLIAAIFLETEIAPVAALKTVTSWYPRIPYIFRALVPQLWAAEKIAVAVEVLSGEWKHNWAAHRRS